MAPVRLSSMSLLTTLLVLLCLFAWQLTGVDAQADQRGSEVPWLKEAEIHTEHAHDAYRRMLGEVQHQTDPYFFVDDNVRITVDDGVRRQTSAISCKVVPVPNGVSTFCDDQFVSGMASDIHGENTKFFQRLDDSRVVSYDGKQNLIQPELENKRTFVPDMRDTPANKENDIVSFEPRSPTADDSKLRQSRDLQSSIDLTQDYLKYVDVYIVVDFPTYQRWGGTQKDVEAKVVTILAQSKQIFLNLRALPFGVNIRLAGIHIFTSKDPFKADEKTASELLSSFNTWREKQNNLPAYAVAHLFTSRNLVDLVGYYARTPVTCDSETASTLSSVLTSSDGFAAKLVAHAVGHALGIQNTNTYSPSWGVTFELALECSGVQNDVMRSTLPVDSADYTWGRCASIWLNTFLSGYPHGCNMACPSDGTMRIYGVHSSFPKCLEPSSRTVKNILATCGDGVVDSGEQCDCGPHVADDDCARRYCCNRATCKRIENCVGNPVPTRSPIFTKPTAKPTPHPTYKSSFECYYLCSGNANGICEDGGPGSVASYCFYGSDCIDCGIRDPYTSRPTVQKTSSPTTESERVTGTPTKDPTVRPTSLAPTAKPTTAAPTKKPVSSTPTTPPTGKPSTGPTFAPSTSPTAQPVPPTKSPVTRKPTTKKPTTSEPSTSPTSEAPTSSPTTVSPTTSPSIPSPTAAPLSPTSKPSKRPTRTRPTSEPTSSPTERACLTETQLKRCRVNKDTCVARKDCSYCTVAGGDKRCLPLIPGLTTCSTELQTYLRNCLKGIGGSDDEETPAPVPESARTVAPTSQPTNSPKGQAQCPTLARLNLCKISKTDCQRRTECSWCMQPNGKARCFLKVDGFDKCGTDHQSFVKACIKSGGGDDNGPQDDETTAPSFSPVASVSTSAPVVSVSTLTPTTSPVASVTSTCPSTAKMSECRVGKSSNCLGKNGCVWCNERCYPILSGMESCTSSHLDAAKACLQGTR